VHLVDFIQFMNDDARNHECEDLNYFPFLAPTRRHYALCHLGVNTCQIALLSAVCPSGASHMGVVIYRNIVFCTATLNVVGYGS
jgi:hypothetical protein